MTAGNASAPRVHRILCSRQAGAALAPLLASADLRDRYELVHLGQGGGPVDADIALVSRDVTGTSTKHDLAPATAEFYEALRTARGLQWVHIHSAGVDRPIFLDLAARGVVIRNSAGSNARAVAHSALAGVLALARRLPTLMAAQRQARWIPPSTQIAPRDLDGQTAVIVGWGPTAQHICQVLLALGLRVNVARHDARRFAQGACATVTYADLPALLPNADWLILACPLSDVTHHLVDEAALARLPAHAHLVNVSRGTVVDEPALVNALQQGRLAGAYLDVFEYEPLPPDSPLWRMEQVIATPHSAGLSDGHYARVLAMFLESLREAELGSTSPVLNT